MTLAELLQELASETAKMIENWKNENKLQKVQKIYIKREIKEIEYDKNGSIRHYVESFTPSAKQEWDWKCISGLISKAKELRVYRKICKKIVDEYNIPEQQAEVWLSRFVHEHIRNYLEGHTHELVNLIVTFINDLEDNPREWTINAWVEGIWLTEIDEIKIDNGMVIRKPRLSDLEDKIPLDLPIFSKLRTFPSEIPSAIIDIHKRAKIKPCIYDELEKLIIILQLYRLGSVSVIKTIWRPKSLIIYGGVCNSSHRGGTPTYTYPLTKRDLDSLPEFVNRISPLLPTDENGRPLSSDPYGIAILRYRDALLKPEAIENKIAYGIMGLEALYLKAEEREELSHRLAQRVAKILGVFGEQPIRTYALIKKGYELRSAFVHGSSLQPGDRQKLKNLLDNILEYLRKSILIFLQLKKDKEKDDFISMVDNSLLDEKAFDKLKNYLKTITI